MVALGLSGVLVFAIGATLVLYLLAQTLRGAGPAGAGFPMFAFMGSLLVGLGLMMIVQDSKLTRTKTPT